MSERQKVLAIGAPFSNRALLRKLFFGDFGNSGPQQKPNHVLRSAESKRLFFVPACLRSIAARKR